MPELGVETLRDAIAIAIAGAAGSLSRWAVSGWAYRLLGDRFAWGTLAVNVLGCLLLGLIMELALGAGIVPRAWRVPITVGFFGAFTTFSTFGYETVRYLEDAAWGQAALNVAANLVLCLAATWVGLNAGRAVLGGP